MEACMGLAGPLLLMGEVTFTGPGLVGLGTEQEPGRKAM